MRGEPGLLDRRHVSRLRASAWDPHSPSNADGFRATPQLAVLLDGAAPRSKLRVSSRSDDTAWLVQRFIERFFEGSDPIVDVPSHVEQVRSALEQEYAMLCEQAGFVPDETPFACLAIAHITAEQIELFNMGDLTTLIRDSSGAVRRFGESAVRQLDRQATALLERARIEGIATHQERWLSVEGAVLANRARRNVLEGYDVLDVAVSSLGRLQQLRCARRQVSSLLLLSDGFYRLVDTFGRYTDVELFDAVERRGLEPLLAELRALELEDDECTAYPRLEAAR
jgi:hypothetical protein